MKHSILTPTGKGKKEFSDSLFEGLQLKGAVLSGKEFRGCSFKNCDLTGASLERCKLLACRFESCNLSLVKLPGSDIGGTFFKDSKLLGVNWTAAAWPKVRLHGPPGFRNCVLSDSSFLGLPLGGAVISGCLARESDFREADLSRADLTGTDFSGGLFGATDLTGADLTGARNYDISPAENKLRNAKFSLPEALSLLYSMQIELT